MSVSKQEIENIVAEEMSKRLQAIIQQLTETIRMLTECIEVYIDDVLTHKVAVKPKCVKQKVYIKSQKYFDEQLIILANECSYDDSNAYDALKEYINSSPQDVKGQRLNLLLKFREYDNLTSKNACDGFMYNCIWDCYDTINRILTHTTIYNGKLISDLTEELKFFGDDVVYLGSSLHTLVNAYNYTVIKAKETRLQMYNNDSNEAIIDEYVKNTKDVFKAFNAVKEALIKLVPDL